MSTQPRQRTHCAVCGTKLPPKKARYCSQACSDTVHKRKIGSPVRRDWTRGTFGEQPMPPHDEIMRRLAQFHRDPPVAALPTAVKGAALREKHPTLRIAHQMAEALIARRKGEV